MTKRKDGKIELIMDQGTKMVEFYRQHPCQAAYDLLGVDLAPIQRLLFRDMWTKNFVVGVCSRGSGKSVHTDSLCHVKNKGLVYLNEELPPIPSYLKDGQEEIIARAEKIYTSEGFKNTKSLCLEKGIQGKQLITQDGFISKGSNHHPLLTLDSNANFVYKSMDEFEPGDKVCIQRNQNVFGKEDIPVDDAYLLGIFIGDGCIVAKYTPDITTEDDFVKKFCIDYCISNNISYRVRDDKRTKNTSSIFLKKFNAFFEKYKVKKSLSYTKEVPYSIRTASRKSQIAFLQGYFDADGTVEVAKGCVSCCSVSKKLIQEVQLMLLNFGIVGRIRKKKTKSKFGKAYLLDMTSVDAYKFKELIGFRLKRKQEPIDKYFDIKVLNPNKDTIPYIKDICWDIKQNYKELNAKRYNDPNLSELLFGRTNKKELTYSVLHKFVIDINRALRSGFLLDDFYVEKIKLLEDILYYNHYFDTVKSVEDWAGDCYDFEMDMDKEPNYFANGFLNHNTFLLGTIAALSCMLYAGYRVGLISAVFRQSVVLSDTYDTFWTSGGLKTTTQGFYDSVEEGVTKTQSLGSQNTILSKWENPERACRSIQTTKGFELAGTVDHGILVLDEELNLVFKDLQDITEDDNIVIKKGFNYFGNDLDISGFEFEGNKNVIKEITIPNNMTETFAYFLGLICGDGFVGSDKEHRNLHMVGFCSSDDELIDKYVNAVVDTFDYIIPSNRMKTYGGCKRVEISNKMLWQFLKYAGMSNKTASEKMFPITIRKSNEKNFAAFIRGLYATDGCCYVNTKGSSKSCTIEYVSVSKQLCKELQAALLNFGIMSSFSIKQKAYKKIFPGRIKESVCKTIYRIRITGTDNLTLFSKYIGCGLTRKQDKLDNYLKSLTKIDFNNTIPNTHEAVIRLASLCKQEDNELHLDHYLGGDKRCKKTNFCVTRIKDILVLAEKNNIFTEDYYKLKRLVDLNLSFVKVVDSKYFFAPTIDVEVENESCYWANGMISHNSKMIFAEVEKLYAQSSLLREACEKRPIRGTDTCYVKFKSVGGKAPSFIEALPLGTDGSKIRGSRFYLLLIDELAQIPTKTIDLVLRPMGVVALAPMERVRRLEKKKKLISLGLAEEDDFEEETVNKMILTSSGYFKFNHMWKRMKDHWSQIEIAEKKGIKSQYAVWQIPYWDLPEGFLDVTNVNEARRVMSSAEFKIEYEAEMVSDSEGFFKASLLEACTTGSSYSIELKGKSVDQYILGVDPNQGGNASCGVVIIKLGPIKHVVNVMELKRLPTQTLTEILQKTCDDYNVVRIFMDSRGGGNALRDLLEEGYGGVEPIIDITNPEHKHIEGRHILDMVDFNTRWISNANFTTKALLENKKLLFPEPPQTISDLEARRYDNINKLKSQMLNIVVTQTGSGNLHFDTPKKNQNKDIYSAMILAAYGAREMEKEFEEEITVLHNSSGLVRERKPGAVFNEISRTPVVPINSKSSLALLGGKRKIK